MTSGKVKFSDHCRVDDRSLKEIAGEPPHLLSFDWHPKLKFAMQLVRVNYNNLDKSASTVPWVSRSKTRSDSVLWYRGQYRERAARLETRLAATASALQRLAPEIQRVPRHHAITALRTLSGISALRVISALQGLEGYLVTESGECVIRLFPDLPRIRHPFVVFPYRSQVNLYVFDEALFLECRVHKADEKYEHWRRLCMPKVIAEAYQEKEPGKYPTDLYYRWILPQWLSFCEESSPGPEGWWISVLIDALGQERYYREADSPWANDTSEKLQDEYSSFAKDDYREVTLDADLAVWVWNAAKKIDPDEEEVDTLEQKHDLFISHASEDKDEFVRPLAKGLRDKGLLVWYDEFSLKLGDSLRESIDRGLR